MLLNVFMWYKYTANITMNFSLSRLKSLYTSIELFISTLNNILIYWNFALIFSKMQSLTFLILSIILSFSQVKMKIDDILSTTTTSWNLSQFCISHNNPIIWSWLFQSVGFIDFQSVGCHYARENYGNNESCNGLCIKRAGNARRFEWIICTRVTIHENSELPSCLHIRAVSSGQFFQRWKIIKMIEKITKIFFFLNFRLKIINWTLMVLLKWQKWSLIMIRPIWN